MFYKHSLRGLLLRSRGLLGCQSDIFCLLNEKRDQISGKLGLPKAFRVGAGIMAGGPRNLHTLDS